MKPLSGTGIYTLLLKGWTLAISQVVVHLTAPAFLQIEYCWGKYIAGDNEQPSEEEYFELTSVKNVDRIVFSNKEGVNLGIEANTELLDILDEGDYNWLVNLTEKGLKDEHEYY